MPTEFLQAYMGLVCRIIYPDGMGEIAELVAIDGDWLKLRNSDKEMLVNTRLVRQIVPMPEKYQEKYRRNQNR